MPAAWVPNRTSAQRISDGLIVGLGADAAARVQIAIQMAFGAMVNALLHDPGPLRLDDDAFGPSVMAALTPYLMEGNRPTPNDAVTIKDKKTGAK